MLRSEVDRRRVFADLLCLDVVLELEHTSRQHILRIIYREDLHSEDADLPADTYIDLNFVVHLRPDVFKEEAR